MTERQPQVRFSGDCPAAPEVVYDVLADLHTHLEWAGARQSSDFRLLSLESPGSAAAKGARFTSTGAIPMSSQRWRDESVVTEASRPSAFEFVTDAKAGKTAARYRHRYAIEPTRGGSRVTYTLTQERIEHPMWRLGLPGVRLMTWRVAIPMYAGRGFRNLLVAAARASSSRPAAALERR